MVSAAFLRSKSACVSPGSSCTRAHSPLDVTLAPISLMSNSISQDRQYVTLFFTLYRWAPRSQFRVCPVRSHDADSGPHPSLRAVPSSTLLAREKIFHSLARPARRRRLLPSCQFVEFVSQPFGPLHPRLGGEFHVASLTPIRLAPNSPA